MNKTTLKNFVHLTYGMDYEKGEWIENKPYGLSGEIYKIDKNIVWIYTDNGQDIGIPKHRLRTKESKTNNHTTDRQYTRIGHTLIPLAAGLSATIGELSARFGYRKRK